MQGNMQAVFVELNCESSFFLFTIGEDGHQQHGAFPGMLSVPPEILKITITESTVERGHGSLRDTEGLWVLLHLLLAVHSWAERQRLDKQDWMLIPQNAFSVGLPPAFVSI